MQRILGTAVLAVGAFYFIMLLREALRDKERFAAGRGKLSWLMPAEALVYFLGASGIPDYVMNTIVARRLRTATDKELPGTLVTATLVPGSIIAFSLLQSEGVVHWTVLVFCGLASMAGSLLGVRLVSRFEGTAIRKIMAVALIFSLVALIARMILSRGAMSDVTALSAPKLAAAVIIIFFTGIVNMFGVPMKATWTAIFLMFGLSPVSTLTMTLVLGCLSPLTGGFSMIRSGNYHQKTAVSAATAGAVGALLGVIFALSLAPLALNIILILVMVIAIVTMLK